jgi:hypothetical protein
MQEPTLRASKPVFPAAIAPIRGSKDSPIFCIQNGNNFITLINYVTLEKKEKKKGTKLS